MLPPKSTSYIHRKDHSIIHHQQARQTQEASGWSKKSSNNATFPDSEYRTVKDVTRLHVAVPESMRLIATCSTEEDSVEFNFANGYGISLHDRILFNV